MSDVLSRSTRRVRKNCEPARWAGDDCDGRFGTRCPRMRLPDSGYSLAAAIAKIKATCNARLMQSTPMRACDGAAQFEAPKNCG